MASAAGADITDAESRWFAGTCQKRKPYLKILLLDLLVTVKAAPHECVIRIGQP